MTSGHVTIDSAFSFRDGESFSSYDQLLVRLEQHSQHDRVHYWRRDSRTIEGASLKTSCPIQPALRYYSVRYACIFGGQKFETRASGGGGRRVRTSLRNDCPAFISLRASTCGQFLRVVAVCNVHNHEANCEPDLAHSKKLPSDERQKVLELLFYGVDRKLIIQYIQAKTGKELSSKDICNLAASLKKRAEFRDMLEDPERTAALTKELTEFVNGEEPYVEEELNDETQEERLLDDVEYFESYETETVKVESIEEDVAEQSVVYHQDTSHHRLENEDSPAPVQNSNRSRSNRWKSSRCFACGSNNRIVRAQLEVLRARRDKLREETKILRLKKKKLQLEIDGMRKC